MRRALRYCLAKWMEWWRWEAPIPPECVWIVIPPVPEAAVVVYIEDMLPKRGITDCTVCTELQLPVWRR